MKLQATWRAEFTQGYSLQMSKAVEKGPKFKGYKGIDQDNRLSNLSGSKKGMTQWGEPLCR